MAIYPVGTIVKTTMGYAIVKESEFGHTLTPTICVFGDINMNVFHRAFDVDLRNCPPDTIPHVLEDMELMPLIMKMKIDPAKFLKE